MKVRYNESENGSTVSGVVETLVDFTEGQKVEVKFSFWWDKKTRKFETIDKGELLFNGRALAYFHRYGNMGNWVLKEHRDNYPNYSDLVAEIYEKLEAELAEKYPVDPSEYMEY